MKLHLRKFQPRDAPRCSAIVMKNFDYVLSVRARGVLTERCRGIIAENTTPEMLIGHSRDGTARMLVTENTEGVLGFISFAIRSFGEYKNSIYVSDCFVDVEFHKMGIGRFQLEQLLRLVRTERLGEIITVHSFPTAIGFYSRFGFVHDPTHDEDAPGMVDEYATERFRLPTIEGPMGPKYGLFMYKQLE